MKKRIWIKAIILCVVCLALLLFKSLRDANTPKPVQLQPVATDQTNSLQKLKAEARPAATSPARMAVNPLALPENATPLARAIAETNPMGARVLAFWQTPIDFYGKVIDQNSNAVEGAVVNFHWVEIPAEDGNRSTNIKSDAEGLFSLTGKRGPDVSIEISKEGYYSRRGGAKYGPGEIPNFTPDPQSPTVFVLQKKGTPAESLVSMKQNYQIPRDGTPVAIDLTTGAKTSADGGNLVVQCWTQDQEKRSGGKYDWRCVVTVPGGGTVQTDEEFPFLAPETGYKSPLEINMPADRTNWTSDVDLKLYYRLASGRYGRMTFSMIAGGQHFFMINSVVNPTGSRNLEPR